MFEVGLYDSVARVLQNHGLKERMRAERRRRSASQMEAQTQKGVSYSPRKIETCLFFFLRA